MSKNSAIENPSEAQQALICSKRSRQSAIHNRLVKLNSELALAAKTLNFGEREAKALRTEFRKLETELFKLENKKITVLPAVDDDGLIQKAAFAAYKSQSAYFTANPDGETNQEALLAAIIKDFTLEELTEVFELIAAEKEQAR